MSNEYLSTAPYKGVRDFYPADMAVQQYIFDTWKKTAESFGFEHYEASILEPAALYRAKGAENAEMVNEQTYTFTDRGDREVTLRPEMTPTVARMIAARQKELAFPVRWYSIPNLFRYERAQRGRLREHWQLNCDIFGQSTLSADVEIIALAYQIFINFGASPDMFEILINNRATMQHAYAALGITDQDTVTAITRLNDRKDKIERDDYLTQLKEIVGDANLAEEIATMIESSDPGDNQVVTALQAMGISNVRIDRSLARGFDYYTGTIFEVKDTHPDNRRALLGGGRYDNLTGLFSSEAVSGIGFGFGDVTIRDFLETHNLMPEHIADRGTHVVVLPMDENQHLYGQQVAMQIRQAGFSAVTDFGTRKLPKRIADAEAKGTHFMIILGEDEQATGELTLKHFASGEEHKGQLGALINQLSLT